MTFAAPRNRPYLQTRAELELIAHDYCRAAQAHARAGRFDTVEAYLDLYADARSRMDQLDAAELDLDIPISVEELDAAFFGSTPPDTLRSHM